MEIDRKRNENLQAYCDEAGKNYSGRVRYQTDLDRGKRTKTAVMIIDESDERMFKDLGAFYQKTKSDKVYVICLTATAYDGSEDNLQRTALKELGYTVYHNSEKKEDFKPEIHRSEAIGGLEEYRTLIHKEREKCGVLIYATGKEFEALKEEDGVIHVTPQVPYLTLETMDAKLGAYYPVFLINEEYGGRGLNFRA